MIEDLMNPAILYSEQLEGNMHYLNTVDVQNNPYLKYNIRNERLEIGWFASERILIIRLFTDEDLTQTRTYTIQNTKQMLYNPRMKNGFDYIFFDFVITEAESTLNVYKYSGVLNYYVGFILQ